jgi:hypothetical protein
VDSSRKRLVPPKALVTLRDSALSPKLFASLRQRVIGLKTERLRSSYQTTFWWPLESQPLAVPELAAREVLALLPHTVKRTVVGCEWWLSRMKTSNVKVDFHVDHDIARFESTRQRVHPTVSSLLYLNRCVGGLLAVTTAQTNPHNPAHAPDQPDFDLAEPRPNRLVWFLGHLTHGVLDSHNAIPGARRAPQKHLRLAVAMNFWSHRPVATKTFAETDHYRSLALAKSQRHSRSRAK